MTIAVLMYGYVAVGFAAGTAYGLWAVLLWRWRAYGLAVVNVVIAAIATAWGVGHLAAILQPYTPPVVHDALRVAIAIGLLLAAIERMGQFIREAQRMRYRQAVDAELRRTARDDDGTEGA